MTQIQVGDTLPIVVLKYCPYDPALENACGIPQVFDLNSLKGKKAVIFGVPGAFTPTCNNQHLPEFRQKYDEFVKKGVDQIICLSTGDAFVMDAWGKWTKSNDKIILASDGNGEFVKATGLDQDLSKMGMGSIRSKRFALVADDLKVTYIGVETSPGVSVSGADAVLAHL
ncbi:thioredoxin-dependent peroxidase [Lobosporangium transversale]|uniref:Thioredoxin-dependent peroxiredoxin n=1 Tax=Lobosporangium transversale TaxID=64571 RepID=A0A1Y2GC93_9FUNG|nr:thioredoxin-dependent peroxidase [Lobosporangium transversale]ORZ02047.1 thioredoxin-dependent peroxidase [Lobosporangium transversale]|eukprot:XP_021876275.1 thioredoxin-dependent peroxidase [Lobosporangium transversale]